MEIFCKGTGRIMWKVQSKQCLQQLINVALLSEYCQHKSHDMSTLMSTIPSTVALQFPWNVHSVESTTGIYTDSLVAWKFRFQSAHFTNWNFKMIWNKKIIRYLVQENLSDILFRKISQYIERPSNLQSEKITKKQAMEILCRIRH